MGISDLVVILVRLYKDKIGLAPNKTKLIKLAYLAEVYYKRLTNRRLTNQEWVFWKYGPYFKEYEEIIENENVFVRPEKANDFYPIEIREDIELADLKLDEKVAVLRALDHATDDLNQILDFVYFDTEPMINAINRGETLNFDSVLPEEYYVIKQYKVNERQGREIINKIKVWEKRKSLDN